MKRAVTPCRKVGCSGLCRDGSGYCERHKADSNWHRYKKPAGLKKAYSSKRWQDFRKGILNRDKGLCQVCRKEGKIVAANEVDHIKLTSKGGAMFDPDNCWSLCTMHHKEKTGAESNGIDYMERINARS